MAGNDPELARILDPFHRQLYKRLRDDLDKRASALASGGAFPGESETKTTAEKYANAVGYIECLNAVLRVSHEIEVEMMGGRPGED